MAIRSLQSVFEHVQRRLRPGLPSVVTDAYLLERFLRHHDEAAFELIMWRHGPMVLGVCRRILRNAEDAEDAFQATFLMLARKAASIGQRDSLSGWLYTVAYRTALRAKLRAEKRAGREVPLDEQPIDESSGDPADLTAWRELRQLLDAELSRLPEKYRTAFILCHLEGKTCGEAAEQLGCPRGTVQSRIGRARERLRARLSQRGWTPGSEPLVHLLEQHASSLSAVTPVLVNATVHSAILLSLGRALDSALSPSVGELMKETAGVMYRRRLRSLLLLVLALLALLGGTALAWGMLSLGSPHKVPENTDPASSSTTSSCHGSAAQPSP